MRTARVRPTGVERSFADHEIIVTKTDLRGVITYANDVFLRISAFTEEQVVGRPHNIIRHPDMPGAVFKLLWDTIRRGDEIFAYVVNLAGDGAEYWVLAHVTPSRDAAGRVTGYHSSRRRPDAPAVAEIRSLYARLRAEERRHPHSTADAVLASQRLLQEELARRGRDYDEFVWDLTLGSRP